MPEIPQAVAPTLTPPPEMNPRIAGEPGRTMANAAEQMGSVADMGFQVAQKIKKAQDEGILLGAENQIGADIEKAQSGLANWTDYTHADQLKQDTATALQEKYAEQYGNRPDLWRHIEPYLVRQTNKFNGLIDKKSAQLTADYNEAQLFDSQLHTENEAATEPTIDGKERIWAIQDAKTDVMVKNGSIRAEKGEQAKKLLRSRTIATEVDHAANPMNAPEIMEAEMARLKEYEDKGYVDPDALERMQDQLATSYERALSRSDRIDVSKIGDAVISSDAKDPTLKDQSTGEIDYLQAAKRVDENPDLSTNVKKYVREEYEQRDVLQKRIVAERNQKIFNSLDDRIGNTDAKGGALTPSEVKQRRELHPSDPKWIPQEVADHSLKVMKQDAKEARATNMQERALARQQAAEDSYELVARLGSQPGYLTRNDIPDLMKSNPKMKYSDALHVVEMRSAQSDPNFQSAMKIFEDAANQGAMTLSDVGEANIAMLKRAKEGVTGTDLLKFASETVRPHVEKDIKNRLDQIVYPQLATPTAASGTAQPGFFSRIGTWAENQVITNAFPTTMKSYAKQESAARQAPEVGAIVDGYKFKGGDPGQMSNWEQVKK